MTVSHTPRDSSQIARFWDCGTLVLSYGSNALPDKETVTSLLREDKQDVTVRAIPHTYHYGTHQTPGPPPPEAGGV